MVFSPPMTLAPRSRERTQVHLKQSHSPAEAGQQGVEQWCCLQGNNPPPHGCRRGGYGVG